MYFDWLCSIIYDGDHSNYNELLAALYTTEFANSNWIGNDINRFMDGLSLRYEYFENNPDEFITTNTECSLLEMMVALSIRIEDAIMKDLSKGCRIPVWFWTMIRNLTLDIFNDDHFIVSEYLNIVTILLDRKYESNGVGGLFRIQNPKTDMRNVEIWYQAMWYLTEVYE